MYLDGQRQQHEVDQCKSKEVWSQTSGNVQENHKFFTNISNSFLSSNANNNGMTCITYQHILQQRCTIWSNVCLYLGSWSTKNCRLRFIPSYLQNPHCKPSQGKTESVHDPSDDSKIISVTNAEQCLLDNPVQKILGGCFTKELLRKIRGGEKKKWVFKATDPNRTFYNNFNTDKNPVSIVLETFLVIKPRNSVSPEASQLSEVNTSYF